MTVDAMCNMMGFKPFDLQREVMLDTHRFKTLCIGRRWGKSVFEAADDCMVAALGGHVWVVSFSYDSADIIFDECLNLCSDPRHALHSLVADIKTSKGNKRILFKTGGQIVPKSSDRPKSLVGRGIDKVSFDEAAKEVNKEIITKYLMPCLSDRQGSMDLISTPEGRNWFFYEYLKGDPNSLSYNSAYRSWTHASNTSPWFSDLEWAYQQANLPEYIFQQEYEAKFLESGGLVFRNLDRCTNAVMYSVPIPTRRYVLGVDIARKNDWTVVTVMDADSRSVVYMERFNQIDWPYIRMRVYELVKRWCGPCLIDSTGIGDVFLQELQYMNLPYGVEGYILSQSSKPMLINSLSLAFQNEDISIPDEGNMRHELEVFAMDRSPTGKFTFEAPPGEHDDIVVSLGLAYEMCLRHGQRDDGGDAVFGERREPEHHISIQHGHEESDGLIDGSGFNNRPEFGGGRR